MGEIPSANDAMRSARTVADAFELNPWVEAEVASLHASLLKDEGLDLELAEKKADEAVALFRTFDLHLAASLSLREISYGEAPSSPIPALEGPKRRARYAGPLGL